MNLTITQDNTRTEIFGNEGSSLAHKLYEIASDLNNTVSLTGSVSVPYAYADEVEYLNTNFGPNFNITAGGTWIKFYHLEIEDAIMSWASLNPGSVGANFASSGHITQDDADSLTQWGKTFTSNTNITQFNEFEKFRNVIQVSLNDCFLGCTNLLSIKLPPRLTYIRGWMFNGCSSLSGVVLPASCTTIGTSGFEGCTSLTSIDLSNVTTLGNKAFKNSGITGVLDLPNLTSLGQYSFYASGVTGATDLGSITEIPQYCFLYSGLLSITLPSTCTTIKSRGLSDMTTLTTVNGGSNLTTIEESAFYNDTNLTAIDLSNVIAVGSSAFYGCSSLTTLRLPNVNNLQSNAFRNCSRLTSINFTGSTFTSTGMNTFRDCSSLTKLVLPTTVTSVGNEWVVGLPRILTVKGLDNISQYNTANWQFKNPIISNPVKTGFVDKLSTMFCVSGNNAESGMLLHSLYEPLRKNTVIGVFGGGNQAKSTFFWNSSSGSANAHVGLLYFKNIESFGYMTFYRTTIDNLVINNTTPPTLTTTTDSTLIGYTSYYSDWGDKIFGSSASIGTLWVPDSAVATYQADPLYSSLTIKGINTKTNGTDYDLPRYTDFAAWETAEEAAVAQGGHAPLGLIEAWM